MKRKVTLSFDIDYNDYDTYPNEFRDEKETVEKIAGLILCGYYVLPPIEEVTITVD